MRGRMAMIIGFLLLAIANAASLVGGLMSGDGSQAAWAALGLVVASGFVLYHARKRGKP